MRGWRWSGARPAEKVHDRDRERGSFVRIGAGPHFVEQYERRGPHALRHLGDVAHVRREGREVGGNGLLVADVGEYLVEDRQDRFTGGDVKSHLGHERNEPDGFEHDRLPACIGPADDQHPVSSRPVRAKSAPRSRPRRAASARAGCAGHRAASDSFPSEIRGAVHWNSMAKPALACATSSSVRTSIVTRIASRCSLRDCVIESKIREISISSCSRRRTRSLF